MGKEIMTKELKDIKKHIKNRKLNFRYMGAFGDAIMISCKDLISIKEMGIIATIRGKESLYELDFKGKKYEGEFAERVFNYLADLIDNE